MLFDVHTPVSALQGSAIMVDQYLHEGILRKHVESLGGKIEIGTELSTLGQDENSVKVHLKKVVDGKTVEETAEFSYVVGADGGHSEYPSANVSR